jgi:TonB family protein
MVTRPGAPKGPASKTLKIASVKQPKLIRRIPPVYPPAALKAEIRGKVVIEAITDIYGHVIKATVISGHPILGQAARQAVLQWVYEPYIFNGIPKPARFLVAVNFDLKKKRDKSHFMAPIEIPDENVEEEISEFGIEGGVVEGVLGGTIGGVNGVTILPGKPVSTNQDKVNRTQAVITGPVGLKSVKVHLPLSGKEYMFLKKMIDKGETYSLTFSFFSIRLKNTLIYLFILLILITMTLIVYKKIKKRF